MNRAYPQYDLGLCPPILLLVWENRQALSQAKSTLLISFCNSDGTARHFHFAREYGYYYVGTYLVVPCRPLCFWLLAHVHPPMLSR